MDSLTLSEKILARAGGKRPGEVRAGDVVTAKVDLVMSHDNAALIKRVFTSIGKPRVFDSSRMVQVLDHRSPAPDRDTAEKHQTVRAFVKEQGIADFYDVGAGICHQVLTEGGHVRPGQHVVGTDSHTGTYGALGAFAYGIGATEMATVWASGALWLRIPETMRATFTGRAAPGVFAKDAILRMVGDLGADGGADHAIEFHGEYVDNLGIGERMTFCNMTVEMDSVAGIVPADARAIEYVRSRITDPAIPIEAVHGDAGSRVDREYALDVDALEPQVACPHRVDNVHGIDVVKGKAIQQAFLGSCVNGRLEDLQEAARVVKGKKVHPEVRFIVTPASREVMLESMRDGSFQTLVESGAVIGTPGCGPCMGAAGGILAPNERCIASSNRNFKGRMGSPDSEVYLASPATVAASALTGEITDPRRYFA